VTQSPTSREREVPSGFDTFVVGSANRLAVAAAKAVSESPGNVYNPLFVYGDSGLGKTHLLQGIAQLAQQLQPRLVTRYAPLVELVDEYHAAVAAGSTDAFASAWQRPELVLIDDIQFLTGRRETQTELLRLFTWMQQHDRQLVLTSDRPPNEIADVDERLIARLAGGLVVDIGVPDFETRAAILRGAAQRHEYDIDESLLNELARIEFVNVREMRGALNRLLAHRSLEDGDVRIDDLARSLGLEPPGKNPRRSVEDFHNYLAGVSNAAPRPTETWRIRVGGVIAQARTEGFRTASLERVLGGDAPEDVETVVSGFTNAIEHLKTLERAATAIDPALAGHPNFRDPEHIVRAETFLERVVSGDMPPPGPSPVFARGLLERSTSNELALRAADAVIARPGRAYNPLFVYGPDGVGKSHLAHAIGNEILARHPRWVVALLPAQRFVDELIAAIGAQTENAWRARYGAVDVLILDDVQALTGKERTQEELFHVFNALYAAGKQMVFTSDQMPRTIAGLEERLRTRLEGGLIVPVGAPDRTLRERVVARTLEQRGRGGDNDLTRALADQNLRGVRDLISNVHRLIAAADAQRVALTASFVRSESGQRAQTTPVATTMRAVEGVFLDTEKVVWEWPDPTSRLIEELR
jgi:chromosomal replication initiation ATPase DnaA